MGTWSHQPFGNDAAHDWVTGIVGEGHLAYLEDTLDAVLADPDDDGDIDAGDAQFAVAAAEVIAASLGRGTMPAEEYPDAIVAWLVALKGQPVKALQAKAVQVLDAIIEPGTSELADLWEESGDETWLESIARLRAAVSAGLDEPA
ncbi:Uncharacterised protein [Bordetella ansorpii]|jgi:hypothetical protein|uniref:DUF4259 domain-containing protein n=1 Tax=Bordetella ansorpii TaxID=288768 RepID=A0A157MW67_9BORD|nr:DUF4259 domain-containing protein [Bordetella ansorpii]SAI13291.1 Uncharacterised protein [Bordetella ansorpii]